MSLKLAWLATPILLACVHLAEAQQPQQIPRTVYLSTASSAPIAARYEAFRQGLRELSYVEGKNISVVWRHAGGQLERLPAIISEVVRLNVNVIVTSGSVTTLPAKKATNTIPIVMAQDPILLATGLSPV